MVKKSKRELLRSSSLWRESHFLIDGRLRAEVAGRRSSQRLSVSGSTASLTSTDSRYEYDAHPKTETSGITDEHTEYLRDV